MKDLKNRKIVYIVLWLMILTAGACLDPFSAAAAGKIAVSSQNMLMKKGQSFRLKLRNAGDPENISWKSSDGNTASVSASGKVKAKKAGTAVITAVYGKKKYTCSVTVSDGKTQTLTVYFSATGTTKKAAAKVQKALQSDIIRLMPEKKYTAGDLNYGNDDSRATKEQNTPSARPALSTAIKNLSQYKTVYLGYPIWWGKEPRLIRTFLDQYSMTGKTVIPFCTSGGSGISGSMAGIREGAKGAAVLTGKDLTGLSQKKVTSWVKKMKKQTESNSEMKMKINGKEIPVTWEDNASVEALKKKAGSGSLTIKMSMYGGFEQVGPLGESLPSSDKYTTTKAGDIVLYSGNQIVVFYGSNSWDYTKLGRITGLSPKELKELLGKEDVTIVIYS